MTYSNVTEQLRSLVTYGLRPYMTSIEQARSIDEDLCPTGSGLYVEFLLDALLRGDAKSRADVYALALDPDRGWLLARRGPPAGEPRPRTERRRLK